jgi:hypothetical protein
MYFSRDRDRVIDALQRALHTPFPKEGSDKYIPKYASKVAEVRAEFSRDLEILINVSERLPDLRLSMISSIDSSSKETLVCKNVITGETAIAVPIEVSFRNLQRAVLAGGLIISKIASRAISVQPLSGTGVAGPVQYVIEENTLSPQVVPFLFLHIRTFQKEYKKRTFTSDLSPGVGLNPDSPGPRAEFALGESLSVGNVYFTGGVHFGNVTSLSNGYKVGETVSQGFSVPTSQGWAAGLMFGISYRIPIK